MSFKCCVTWGKLFAFSESVSFHFSSYRLRMALPFSMGSGYSQCFTPISSASWSLSSVGLPCPSFHPTCSRLPFLGQHFSWSEMTILLSKFFSSSELLSFLDLNLQRILIRAQE